MTLHHGIFFSDAIDSYGRLCIVRSFDYCSLSIGYHTATRYISEVTSLGKAGGSRESRRQVELVCSSAAVERYWPAIAIM